MNGKTDMMVHNWRLCYLCKLVPDHRCVVNAQVVDVFQNEVNIFDVIHLGLVIRWYES